MKLVKSLLLGTAGGLVAVAGAQAADLPSRKAAPAAEFVRVCSAYGAGFFFIPGTDTCLRVSGQVRAEYGIAQTYTRLDDTHGFRARARVNLDARTQTGWGTLRTFIRLEANRQDGQYNLNFGRFNGVAARNGGLNSPAFTTEPTLAFIQFAGLTAGRYTSFFDFYGTDAFWNFAGISGTQGTSVNGLAYTATFGGGFSATIALESRADRELGLGSNAVAAGVISVAGVATPVLATANTNLLYAGSRWPDLVGVLRVQQGWGTAQLMGAVRDVNLSTAGAAPITGSKTGYAIGAGVMFNLPMLAPGSQLYLEGVYAQGALSYLGMSSSVRIGYANVAVADYAFNLANRTARLAEGYSLMAALRHFWTPTVRQAIFAGYTNVSYGAFSGVGGALPSLTSTTGLRSFSKFEIGTNVIWSPVPGLDVGVEVLYKQVDPRGRFSYTNSAGVPNLVKGSESGWEGRLRIQRDF